MDQTTRRPRQERLDEMRKAADAGVAKGTITTAERDALLLSYVDTREALAHLASEERRDDASRRRTAWILAGVGVLIICSVILLFSTTGTGIGAVTLDVPINTTTGDTNLTNVTGEGPANDMNSTTPNESNSTLPVSASDPPPGTLDLTNVTSMNRTDEMDTANDTTTTVTNEIVNTTDANETVSVVTPSVAAPPPSDCSDPDPNQRPLDCLQSKDSTYFLPEEILLKDNNAVTVGRLTPVGNLFITGNLVEHSTGTPRSNDYQLGYTTAEGALVPTMWIDSANGDLHLRGMLTEANGNLIIRDGQIAITNQAGIVLALLQNATTGDFVVRGNIIPRARSLG